MKWAKKWITQYKAAFFIQLDIKKKKNKNHFLMSHLASDVLVNQMVFAFVVEDNVNFLCARAANIRTLTKPQIKRENPSSSL